MIVYITKTATGEIVTDYGPGILAYMEAKLEATALELVVVARKVYGDKRATFETLHDYTRKELVK